MNVVYFSRFAYSVFISRENDSHNVPELIAGVISMQYLNRMLSLNNKSKNKLDMSFEV